MWEVTSSMFDIHSSPKHFSPLPTSPSLSLSPPPLSGVQRKRWTMHSSSPDIAYDMELTTARRWIEECTGCVEKQKGFREYLQDGTLLCELVQKVQPHLIRRIKRVKSPFAWRENLVFFLEACKSLGLKGSQLFTPEDLITSGVKSPATKARGFRGENERRLRNVAITVFWLSRVVRKLPDYSGPLLDLYALGDWEHSELTFRRDGNHSAEPTSPCHTRTHSYTPPQPTPQQRNKNSFSPPPPPVSTSPYHSPTIKVKQVESVVSHTDQTSYPQVIVRVGRRSHQRSSSSGSTHSRSNSLTENRVPESLQQQKSKAISIPALPTTSHLTESEKVLSDLSPLSKGDLGEKHWSSKELQHTTTNLRVNSVSSDIQISLNSEEGKGEEEVSLQELINVELQLNRQKLPLVSHNSPRDIHRSSSVNSSTPSEGSTIVPRDLTSSRCSGILFPEDTGRNTTAEHLESDQSAPAIKDHSLNSESPGYSGAVSGHPLSYSSQSDSQESPQVVSAEPAAVVHSKTLFRASPLLDVEALLSNLSQSDSIDSPSPLVSAPSDTFFPPTHPSSPASTTSAVVQQHQTSEEESVSEPDLSAASNTSLQSPLLPDPKEQNHKSVDSSSSNLDSAPCSEIYCYNTDSDRTSSTDHSAQDKSNYSSTSEDNFEVVPEPEPVNHYLVDLEAIESSPHLETNPGTHTHCQSDFEQVDLEAITEEMAVTTQVMRIYPAQSVGETSSDVKVPHHRVHLPSSSSCNGLESPSKRMSTAQGSSTVLYMTPSLVEIEEKEITLVEEETPEVSEALPIMVAALQDEEEEEDGDAEPVITQNGKTNLGVISRVEPRIGVNLSLTLPVRDGGGSLARVQSDALPLTLHAHKLTVPEPDASKENEEKSDFSDFNSIAVEIGSSMDSLTSSKVSLTASHQSAVSLALSQRSASSSAVGSHGELHAHIHKGDPRHHKQQSDDSFITSVLAPSHPLSCEMRDLGVPAKRPRPGSAPSRATSDSILPPHSSSFSSYATDSLKIRNRRTSSEDERQKRLANIAESARAARMLTANRNAKSLPRERHHQHSRNHLGSKSFGSEEELLESTSPSNGLLKDTVTVQPTDSGSPSPSFNLNNLSIDETREASLNEMEEIWKLVENESEGSSTSMDTSVGGSIGGRGPPSIALERHLSPQHMASKSNHSRKEKEMERRAMPLSSLSPVRNPDKVSGRNKEVANQHIDTDLDVSEAEVSSSMDQVPLQSTPKRPGLVQPAAPNVSLLGSEKKPGPISRKGIDSLLTTLRSLGAEGGGGEMDGKEGERGLRLLEQMLHSNTFKRAQKVHDTIQQLVSHDKTAPKPFAKRVVPITQEMRHHFHHHTEPCPEVDELRVLLREPHIQALMFCHDRVSSEDYYIPRRHYPRIKLDPVDIVLSGSVLNYVPATPLDNSLPLSRDVPSARKEDATIVYLTRTNRPLGCTIYKQGESVFVGKLLKNCDAELSEVLREGDELLEVNGVPVARRSTDEIVRLMSGEAGVTLAFTIIPIHDDNIDINYEPKYVRAHFNYSPKADEEIPCQPLGLKFEKGDILEISNQDDPDWWQARKVFDDGAESLPGLIPARHRQQQREAQTRSYPLAKAMEDQHKKKGLMSKLTRKKKKTVFYNQAQQLGVLAVGDEVVTYEDVARMDPHPQWRRPIILIGASGVGKGTLIRKLINSDHTHFAAVVQHTTRTIHPGEVNGHTYHFVSREEFELDILQERFLEHQEFKGHLYGTSVSAVKKIVESGRVPVLDLQPQSLKRVRYSGLMPYVVFVASPRLERLVVTRRVGTERPQRRSGSGSSTLEMDSNQIYTEPELQHLLVESRLIESQYSHYFDWIIVNDDLSVASDMLKEVARRAEEETQWVPASWLADQPF